MSKFRFFLVNNKRYKNILSHFKQYFKGKHKDVSPYRNNNVILQEWGVSLSNLTSSSYIVDARKHLCELSMFELSNLINYNKNKSQ